MDEWGEDGGWMHGFGVLLRCLVSMVTGAVGMVLAAALGLYGVGALDDALGSPLGESGGFLSFGHLTTAFIVVGTPLGSVFGALGGHALLKGRGSFWAALGAMFLALLPVVVMSLAVRGLVFPALLLLPVFAAVCLELDDTRVRRREEGSP